MSTFMLDVDVDVNFDDYVVVDDDVDVDVDVQERLEFDLLGDSGIVKNPKKFFNTVIKLKTKLL